MKIIAVVVACFLCACGGSPFSAATATQSEVGADAAGTDAATIATADSGTLPSADAATDTAQPDAAQDVAPMCITPTTPMLTGTQGLGGTGLQFHVTQDEILTSFVFTGGGQQDTVTLFDSECNSIASASVPGVFPPVYAPYTVNVRWMLKANVTYRLTNSNTNQTAYASAKFPYISDVLTVEQGLVTCVEYGQDAGPPEAQVWWTAFTDLTFCNGN